MKQLLIKWFYKTDLILDEGDLDSFHDKSIVKTEAGKLAVLIYALMFSVFMVGFIIGFLV